MNGVAEPVFPDKPIGIITAAARGEYTHKELKLIIETLQTQFTEETTLLIQGIKGKFNQNGNILDSSIENKLGNFARAFNEFG